MILLKMLTLLEEETVLSPRGEESNIEKLITFYTVLKILDEILRLFSPAPEEIIVYLASTRPQVKNLKIK